jgi:hypothetical protein
MKNQPKQGRIWPELPDIYDIVGSLAPPPAEDKTAEPEEPTSDPRQRPLPGFTPA